MLASVQGKIPLDTQVRLLLRDRRVVGNCCLGNNLPLRGRACCRRRTWGL